MVAWGVPDASLCAPPQIDFDFEVRDQEGTCEVPPEDGVYCRGLFIEGCKWDYKRHVLTESDPKVRPHDVTAPRKGRSLPSVELFTCRNGATSFVWWGRALQVPESPLVPHVQVLFVPMPVIWMQPMETTNFKDEPHYVCPLYKTAERRGVLSTTGHSTNFVMDCRLPSSEPAAHWIKRGVAMLTSLSE